MQAAVGPEGGLPLITQHNSWYYLLYVHLRTCIKQGISELDVVPLPEPITS